MSSSGRTPSPRGASSAEDGWHDAGVEADYCWYLYRTAKTVLDQADALVRLSKAMSDLRSWLPGFDADTGTLPWEREDDDPMPSAPSVTTPARTPSSD